MISLGISRSNCIFLLLRHIDSIFRCLSAGVAATLLIDIDKSADESTRVIFTDEVACNSPAATALTSAGFTSQLFISLAA